MTMQHSDLEKRVLNALQTQPTVSREDLQHLTLSSDRACRKAVESLREQGFLIISTRTKAGAGYTLQPNKIQAEAFLRSEKRRLQTLEKSYERSRTAFGKMFARPAEQTPLFQEVSHV